MGDRGNIAVKQQGNSQIWFYAHWSGSKIKDVTKEALAKKWRWDDEAYLARIIFDQLTKGRNGEETSFGISTRILDNEYPIVVVDVPEQRVFTIEETELTKEGQIPPDFEPDPKRCWSFSAYIGEEPLRQEVRKATRAKTPIQTPAACSTC